VEVFDHIRVELTDGRVPPLKGIIHAAGVMQYEPLTSQSAERMLEVMRAKVIGGWLLHGGFRDQPIDIFVMFSSTSSMLNSPFMGAYAAANTFLDALAAYRWREGLPALSVSWGTWLETGMAVEGERVAGAPRSMLKGVGTLSNQDGLDALDLLLRYNTVHAGVMPMDWEEWRRAYPVFSSVSFFRDLMESGIVSPVPDYSDDQFGRQAARVAAAAGKVDNLVDYLTREIAVALKTTPERVPANVPLPSFGFDSLMAVEIKNRIEIDLQVEMPVVKLLEGQSINYLSDFLSKKLTVGIAAGAGIQMPSDGNRASANQGEQNWEEGTL
jgi:acyl carrier protein